MIEIELDRIPKDTQFLAVWTQNGSICSGTYAIRNGRLLTQKEGQYEPNKDCGYWAKVASNINPTTKFYIKGAVND